VSAIFQIVTFLLNLWSNRKLWQKYLILGFAYTANIAAILTVYFSTDTWVQYEYFGGDPEGSFGMLFIPSVILYAIIGGILIASISVYRFMRTHLFLSNKKKTS
jgi:hypothetical protein